MRLAFEAALRRSGADVSALEAAPPEQQTSTWTGPRDAPARV